MGQPLPPPLRGSWSELGEHPRAQDTPPPQLIKKKRPRMAMQNIPQLVNIGLLDLSQLPTDPSPATALVEILKYSNTF